MSLVNVTEHGIRSGNTGQANWSAFETLLGQDEISVFYFPSGIYRFIRASESSPVLVVGKNKKIIFDPAAMIQNDDLYLRIEATIEAGYYQIFIGRSWIAGFNNPVLKPQWWGAGIPQIDTNINSDSTALANLFRSIQSNRTLTIDFGSNIYTLNTSLIIKHGIKYIGHQALFTTPEENSIENLFILEDTSQELTYFSGLRFQTFNKGAILYFKGAENQIIIENCLFGSTLTSNRINAIYFGGKSNQIIVNNVKYNQIRNSLVLEGSNSKVQISQNQDNQTETSIRLNANKLTCLISNSMFSGRLTGNLKTSQFIMTNSTIQLNALSTSNTTFICGNCLFSQVSSVQTLSNSMFRSCQFQGITSIYANNDVSFSDCRFISTPTNSANASLTLSGSSLSTIRVHGGLIQGNGVEYKKGDVSLVDITFNIIIAGGFVIKTMLEDTNTLKKLNINGINIKTNVSNQGTIHYLILESWSGNACEITHQNIILEMSRLASSVTANSFTNYKFLGSRLLISNIDPDNQIGLLNDIWRNSTSSTDHRYTSQNSWAPLDYILQEQGG